MAAAHDSGAASKPLALFYALSQAGRAIAAARVHGEPWHDAYGLVSKAIGSDTLASAVSLAAVWPA